MSQRNPQHKSPRGERPPTDEKLKGALLVSVVSLEVDPNDGWRIPTLRQALAYCQTGSFRQATVASDQQDNVVLSSTGLRDAH